MFVNAYPWSRHLGLVLAALLAASSLASAAPAEKPVAGKVVHFPQGVWSALPQLGPDGKVRQCVLGAARDRVTKDGPVTKGFSFKSTRGSGVTPGLQDRRVPTQRVRGGER